MIRFLDEQKAELKKKKKKIENRWCQIIMSLEQKIEN